MSDLTFDELFDACLSSVRSTDKKADLAASRQYLRACDKIFQLHAHLSLLELMTEATPHRGCAASKADLIDLYEQKFVKNAAGRAFYKRLRGQAPHDTCLLCHHNPVKTLDHYLPKDVFPSLSIAPKNLIPSCRDCNMDKGVERPTSAETLTLHPEYDRSMYSRDWLEATLDPVDLCIRFDASRHLTPKHRNRVRHHLKTHDIHTTYATHAGRETVMIAAQIQNHFANPAPPQIIQMLDDQLQDLEKAPALLRPSCAWQIALRRSLRDSPFFVQGGYQQFIQ